MIPAYVASVQKEMQMVAESGPGVKAATLYFGGGTPSLLSARQIGTLIQAAREVYALPQGAEITVEVNPGTATVETLVGYRAHGVSRVSLGVQSVHADELRLFGRRHTFEETEDAFHTVRAAGFANISLDLIYGAPTQTLTGWEQTLDTVLGWGAEHFSIYALTIEPGTSFARRVRDGTLTEPEVDVVADMYDLLREKMRDAGYRQYEISSWARPGRESNHNRQYWLNRPYLGFGPGAHGMSTPYRYWTVKPVKRYIDSINDAEAGTFPFSAALDGYEVISPALERAETMILGLRMAQGINRDAFEARHGQPLDTVYGDVIRELTEWGLLEESNRDIRLTEHAFLISNRVFARFLPDED